MHKDRLSRFCANRKEKGSGLKLERSSGDRRGIAFRAEAIPDAGIRQDEPGVSGILFEFFPELPDEDAQVLGLVYVGLSPYFLQEHAVCEHFAWMFDHVFEEVILGRRQLDRLLIQRDLPPVKIHAELARDENRLRVMGSRRSP